MHAATQGAIINILPTFLYFFNTDSLILGAQLIHLCPKQQETFVSACNLYRCNMPKHWPPCVSVTDQAHGDRPEVVRANTHSAWMQCLRNNTITLAECFK